MTFSLSLCAILWSTVFVSALAHLGPGKITTLVTFGDSYTDVISPADGGRAWPLYAEDYGPFKLWSFAIYGSTCSDFPSPGANTSTSKSALEGQIPMFLKGIANGTIKLDWEETLFTLWIGANDVGVHGLLTGEQRPGVTLVNTARCYVEWATTLYEHGARNFLIQNMVPLELTVLFSQNFYYNRYWVLERHSTEWSVTMRDITNSGNELSRLMLQSVAPSLPWAHIGVFDSYGLFTDMYTNPADYLNGTSPFNVTGCVHSCVFPYNGNVSDLTSATCMVTEGSDRDSFLWYDELHPSEQSDRTVAREITAAAKGRSSNWVAWYS